MNKKKYLIISIGFVLVTIKYFMSNDDKNYPYLTELKSNDKYEVIQLISIAYPYSYGFYSHKENIQHYGIQKDEKENLYIVINNDDYKTITSYAINKNLKLTLLEEENKDNPSIKFLNTFYTRFVSNEIDEEFIKRNELRNLNPLSKKPIVKYTLENYELYFIRNFKNFFCWNLNPSKCSKSPRKATYYIDIPTKNGTIKFKAKGNYRNSYTRVYYVNNLEQDSVLFFLQGCEMYAIKIKKTA